MEPLEDYLQRQRRRVEVSLDAWLPALDSYPPTLMDAMRYSVFAGGKRLRPILLLAATEAVGGDTTAVLPAACALEFIHTYSMIHDDLPAMDDDAYLRGTALEYLETVLPARLFSALGPLLAVSGPPPQRKRTSADARAESLRAGTTMMVSRDELRRQLEAAARDES